MSGRRQYNEDSVSIRLSSGGSVTLSFKGTLFELTDDEQGLVRDLTLTIQRYRAAAASPSVKDEPVKQ